MKNHRIELWLERIFGFEGGYSNRNSIDDPGGETKWGISKKSYPNLDIKNLTRSEASLIYKNDFLLPILNANLKDGVTYQLFDFGVHSGILTAIKELQKALMVKPDGIIGPITKQALDDKSERDVVIMLLSARLEYMVNLSNWHKNSRGWARRIATNLHYAIADT